MHPQTCLHTGDFSGMRGKGEERGPVTVSSVEAGAASGAGSRVGVGGHTVPDSADGKEGKGGARGRGRLQHVRGVSNGEGSLVTRVGKGGSTFVSI